MTLTVVADKTSRPLILDVDGTLIKSDLTHEMILEAIKRDPLRAVRYARLGASDKTAMKAEMVDRIGSRLRISAAPLEPKIVALAHKAKAEGRQVQLCSGSEQSLVTRLAERLDFIDGAFGTTPGYNMTSARKAAFLQDRFPDGFDYAGNSTQDFKVWEAAQTAYGVRPPKGTNEMRTAAGHSVTILEPRRRRLWPLLRTLRPVLWPAAGLAALPGLYAWWSKSSVNEGAVITLILCAVLLIAALSASDDLADIQRDRTRADMKDRPLAAGELSVPSAITGVLTLLAAMMVISIIKLPALAALGLFATYIAGLFTIRLKGRSATIVNTGLFGLSLLGLGVFVA